MEKKDQNDESKSIHDILPLELIHGILLRVPTRHLARLRLTDSTHLHGFGYDASQDDYLVVAAWGDSESQEDHLECLSLKTNSWINLDAALPNPLGIYHGRSRGLFLNGAIHWVSSNLKDYRDAILIFDLKERTFSMISAPEQLPTSAYFYPSLALLGGCLALYYHNNDSYKTHIWVMKEYKVQCSWTLYQIPSYGGFQPLCLSSNRYIIGRFYQRVSCNSLVTLRIRITKEDEKERISLANMKFSI
ncbi:F-box/kelch-repeat protein At3g06240-like [Arachis stenosperma]|uniref:F-box/kelch-repeat protein At3g06240-like n=1 Tax=Arachis stenosperma TaxID=217475 RepID=UPI0025AD8282|nr:F-box/kelch-repeat protein At3g06240-like [Arachis stenosperma]